MERTGILDFNVRWHDKTISALACLAVLPNLLGMINIPTAWGFNIHVFQLAVFIAAFLYGPKGGALCGATGSLYTAVTAGNPYLLIGNVILGFFAGLFFRYGIRPVWAALLAYGIQIPWIVATDYYFMHLPVPFIQNLLIALALSNILWSVIAHLSLKPLRSMLEC